MGHPTILIQSVAYCGDFLDGYSHLEIITIIKEPWNENCFNTTISTAWLAQEVRWLLGHCAGV